MTQLALFPATAAAFCLWRMRADRPAYRELIASDDDEAVLQREKAKLIKARKDGAIYYEVLESDWFEFEVEAA